MSLALAAIVGLLLGLAVAFLRELEPLRQKYGATTAAP